MVMEDPSKYVTLDFMMFLIKKYLSLGMAAQAEQILLDPKISVNLFPYDLFAVYFDYKVRKN